MKRKITLAVLTIIFLVLFINAFISSYSSQAGLTRSISVALDNFKYIAGLLVPINLLIGASLYLSRIHDNEHFLKGIDALEIVPLTKVHSDKRDNLYSYFKEGTAGRSKSEITQSSSLIKRDAAGRAQTALAEGKIAVIVRGEEASGRTVLVWQSAGTSRPGGRFSRLVKRRLIQADASKLNRSTLEAFYNRLIFLRACLLEDYVIIFDDFDSRVGDLSQARGYLEAALSREDKIRKRWPFRLISWGRVYYVFVSEALEFDQDLQTIVSTKLVPDEETALINQFNKELKHLGTTEPIDLRTFWLKIGGRRSYEGSISSFIANAFLAVGNVSQILPAGLEDSEDLTKIARYFAAFTVLSMPVPNRVMPKEVSEGLSKVKQSEKLFLRASIDDLQGIRLRLKTWSLVLLSSLPEKLETYLANCYSETFKSIGADTASVQHKEWVRTLLHRLFKRRHIGMVELDGVAVGKIVVRDNIESIRKWIANERNVDALAFWSGTIASIQNSDSKLIYPDIVVECIRKIALADRAAINNSPKAFTSLAKAVASLRRLPADFDITLADGARARASEILSGIDFDAIIRKDYAINAQSDWPLRYSQSVASYFKWQAALLPKSPHAAALEAQARLNRDVIAFIDNVPTRYQDLNISLNAPLLLQKARAQLALGSTDRAIETFTAAAALTTNELRESGDGALLVHRDRTKALLKHRPDDITEILKSFIAIFEDLSQYSDFINSGSFREPYEEFLSLCEKRPEAVQYLMGDELYKNAAGPCFDRSSEGSLIFDRYLSVIKLSLDRIRFPRSGPAGVCIQTFLLGLHGHMEEELRKVQDRQALHDELSAKAWGSGLQFFLDNGTLQLRKRPGGRGER
ncbi:hypothetical protein ACC676_01150 [Rhizobium ruizarguesonis]